MLTRARHLLRDPGSDEHKANSPSCYFFDQSRPYTGPNSTVVVTSVSEATIKARSGKKKSAETIPDDEGEDDWQQLLPSQEQSQPTKSGESSKSAQHDVKSQASAVSSTTRCVFTQRHRYKIAQTLMHLLSEDEPKKSSTLNLPMIKATLKIPRKAFKPARNSQKQHPSPDLRARTKSSRSLPLWNLQHRVLRCQIQSAVRMLPPFWESRLCIIR